ncbi:MAG: DUF748 domain-containing protein, partial [Candidatus Omnitrophica bacterium]|nr:DUF748 domain-containing protein [Candidatus Omnitrophota bacterium]
MMKHKWIIITLSVIFFLTALTFYANRILLPTVVKKIAIEQAQNFLKRKVEIESLHFNWIKGVIINKIKVYQKDSTTDVLVQAEKVSMGIIFIPGVKHHKLVLPYINVESPFIHLIHQADNTWNFSDLLMLPAPKSDDKPSPVAVSVGGINILNGKVLLEDVLPQQVWSETLDPINVKVGLSLEGISFDGNIALPQRQGFIALNGAYQPLTQSLKTSLNLKNIKPTDYLGLLPMKLPLTLTSGTINDVDVQINYAPDHMGVQGNWSVTNIDLTVDKQNIKTDMDVRNADITLIKNIPSVKGDFSFANTKIVTPTFSVSGVFKANVDHFVMNSPEDINLQGSLLASEVVAQLPKDQSFQGKINARITEGHLTKDALSLEGELGVTQAFIILSDQQNLKGDLNLKHIKMTKNKDHTTATSDLSINGFDIRLPGQVFKGNLTANSLGVTLDQHNNIKLQGPIEIDHLEAITEQAKLRGLINLTNIKA